MIIPPQCEPWVMRQRTGMGAPAEYARVIERVYENIRPHLPPAAETILDIGCGMAGIQVYLRKHYPDAKLMLLDGDGDETRNGWNATLGAFNSRSATEALLAANGIPRIERWYDINTKERLEADLVISLASWGYHYPLATYDAHGYCIADLRIPNEPPRGVEIRRYQKRVLCAWRM